MGFVRPWPAALCDAHGGSAPRVHLWLPMIVHDPVAMVASLQRLRALAAVGARIVYGHDPESWATMLQAPLAIT
jgi:glyoxylase-like metal-dependent hydrolase (beta-lactamase superfamily II)